MDLRLFHFHMTMCSLNLTENPSDKLTGKLLFKVKNESTGLLMCWIIIDFDQSS